MTRLGILHLIPLKVKALREAWRIVEKHHLYEADALQIASAKTIGASLPMTAGKEVQASPLILKNPGRARLK